MKKLVALLLAVLLLVPAFAMAATEFDVTEPITITASAPTKAEALMMARIIGAQCKERIGDDVIREITEE